MFWFCKPKPLNVYFYTTREEVFEFSKPQSAAKFIPSWIKQLPPPHFPDNADEKLMLRKNIKSCPGVIDLYKSSFMLQMWSDLNIEINPDKSFRYQFIDQASKIDSHINNQFAGSYFAENHINIKFINPWQVKTDQNVKLLFLPPVWNNCGYGDILLPPGIVNYYLGAGEMNVNFLFKVPLEKTIYEFMLGQPLAHVVPLTERPVKYHYELINEKDLFKMRCKNPLYLLSRNRQRRAEKLCPHA